MHLAVQPNFHPTKAGLPRILLLDDDKDWLDEASEGLSEEYTVVTTDDLNVAETALRRHGFDAFVLDHQMPRMSGIDFVGALVNHDSPVALPPMVLVTGHDVADLPVAAMRLGFSDFLTKPLETPDLLDSLSRVRGRGAEPSCANDPVLQILQDLRRLEERKTRYLGAGADAPSWRMILEIMEAQTQGGPIKLSSVCAASGAPYATAHRKLDALVASGMVIRHADPGDDRRVLLSLSPKAETQMDLVLGSFSGR